MNNRRKFFEDYAKENGFDSLVAADWYSQAKELIWDAKVFLIFRFINLLSIDTTRIENEHKKFCEEMHSYASSK
jgi:hypothetical protein